MNRLLSSLFLLALLVQQLVALCPVGSIEGPGASTNGLNCYKIFGQPTIWSQAENNCVLSGGHLASVSNAFLNRFLLNQAEDVFYNSAEDFWLGGSTLLDASQWTWSDDSNFTYTNWGRGQPIGPPGTYCMSVDIPTGQWFSEPCSSSKPYVCEIQDTPMPTCPTCQVCTTPSPVTCPTPPPWVPSCPNGFTYYARAQMCYQILHNVNFNDALTTCQLISGATLASIHSQDQNTFLATFASDRINNDGPYFGWIGFRKSDGGSWAWLDNTNVDYTNWAQDEPVDISGYDCGAFYTDSINNQLTFGYWAAQPCDTVLRTAVCQVPVTQY